MTCNCNRADCKAETNARGCCPFRRPRRVLDPRTLVSITDEEYAARERTHAGRDLSWGPFDPQPRDAR